MPPDALPRAAGPPRRGPLRAWCVEPLVTTPRDLARYAVVLLAGIIAGSRIVEAYVAWQQYRELRGPDPSGADASLTFAQVDLAIALVCLAIAGLVWWLLRPRVPSSHS